MTPLALLLAASPAAAETPVSPLPYIGREGRIRVSIPRLEESMTVHGSLDDPAWARAAFLGRRFVKLVHTGCEGTLTKKRAARPPRLASPTWQVSSLVTAPPGVRLAEVPCDMRSSASLAARPWRSR